MGGNGPIKKLQGDETLWCLDGQAGVVWGPMTSPLGMWRAEGSLDLWLLDLEFSESLVLRF